MTRSLLRVAAHVATCVATRVATRVACASFGHLHSERSDPPACIYCGKTSKEREQ